jgi:BioD-like phosphotransacetylase family protein
VKSIFGAYLQRQGMQLFGILPAGRLPGTFSVAELAQMLNGQIITGGSGEDVMVDRFVVGAMGPEAALRHFLRQANKAVITGGDRTDVILAALETSTRCIILTGNLIPEQVAIATAAHRQVPLMVVPSDTMETIRMIEEASGPVRLTTLAHVEALRGLTDRELYVAQLLRALGL